MLFKISRCSYSELTCEGYSIWLYIYNVSVKISEGVNVTKDTCTCMHCNSER